MKKNLNSFNALKSLKVGEKVYKYFNIKEAENNGLNTTCESCLNAVCIDLLVGIYSLTLPPFY